jgi:chromosome segregation ATPase
MSSTSTVLRTSLKQNVHSFTDRLQAVATKQEKTISDLTRANEESTEMEIKMQSVQQTLQFLLQHTAELKQIDIDCTRSTTETSKTVTEIDQRVTDSMHEFNQVQGKLNTLESACADLQHENAWKREKLDILGVKRTQVCFQQSSPAFLRLTFSLSL